MNWFGIVFIVATTLVFIFKRETELIADDTVQLKEDDEDEEASIEESLTVTETYNLMWKILWLVPIKKIILILMTVKVS